MRLMKIKKVVSILLILIGGIALISEIASRNKNYYVQTIGIVALMTGLFIVNTKVKSKADLPSKEYFEEE